MVFPFLRLRVWGQGVLYTVQIVRPSELNCDFGLNKIWLDLTFNVWIKPAFFFKVKTNTVELVSSCLWEYASVLVLNKRACIYYLLSAVFWETCLFCSHSSSCKVLCVCKCVFIEFICSVDTDGFMFYAWLILFTTQPYVSVLNIHFWCFFSV